MLRRRSRPPQPTEAQREAQLAKCRELRKMYNEAGAAVVALE